MRLNENWNMVQIKIEIWLSLDSPINNLYFWNLVVLQIWVYLWYIYDKGEKIIKGHLKIDIQGPLDLLKDGHTDERYCVWGGGRLKC